MEPDDLDARLTSISTQWTKLFAAHQDQGDAAAAAQRELLLRYYGAVYRYLLGTLRDPAAAEELAQEFAVRFLRGDFKRADPQRGRFRDFVKTALRHLAQDHWRKQERAPAHLPPDGPGLAGPGPGDLDVLDQPFLDRWREELLAQAWAALAEVERQSGQPYHAVLRGKVEGVRSAQLAARLSAGRGKPFTEDGVRQVLHRAREKFAELLVEEVARSLQTSEPEALERELIELGLLDYCRSALPRRGRSA
jgi:RNA polymerase sigma-70 factor (ECF subfamily)